MVEESRDRSWVRFRQRLRADRPFYLAIVLYLDLAILAALVFDREFGGPLQLIGHMLLSIVVITGNMGLIWFGGQTWLQMKTGRRLSAAIAKGVEPEYLSRFLMLPALSVFLSSFNTIKILLPDCQSRNYDVVLADLDRMIHGVDPWKALSGLLTPDVMNVLQAIYLPGWTYTLMVVTGYVCISKHAAHIRSRYITVFLIAWPFLGNILAALLLSDGPAFYGRVTGDESRYGDLVSLLSVTQDHPFSAYVLQNVLWDYKQAQAATEGSGISAFPSLHVAMATLMGLALVNIKRRYVWFALPFLTVILFGSVALGWHYALDGYASIILIVGLWYGVGAIQRGVCGRALRAAVSSVSRLFGSAITDPPLSPPTSAGV